MYKMADLKMLAVTKKLEDKSLLYGLVRFQIL